MLVKMTGIQRLRYHAMIGRDNPFRDVMMEEIVSGNMYFSDPTSIDDPETIVDSILEVGA